MIKAGDLDRRISVQRSTPTDDSYGEPIPSWAQIGRVRWARYRPLSGQERFAADQFIAQEQVEFTIRWSTDLEDLNPKDRIVYPAEGSANSTIYDIMAVHEIGRREGWRILTARRAEQ